MANKRNLTRLYNSYLVSKRRKDTMQSRYRYTAYRKAGGKRGK